MDTDYDDWEPPSASELKLLQARRERSDKISKLMGDYLLKGYKMLGSSCRECDTILLQTKQGTNYCIACSELDSDADKDDPVTNQAAALALAREREVISTPPRPFASQPPSEPNEYVEISSTNVTSESSHNFHSQAVNFSANATSLPSSSRANLSGAGAQNHGKIGDSQKYVRELLDKLDWAVAELRETRNVEYSIQLCQLVKGCAEAVSSVRAALDL